MKPSFSIALTLCMSVVFASSSADEFIQPKDPLAPQKRRAPSPKVVNGTVYESGSLKLEKGQTLVLPDAAVVKPHDGDTVRFYVTKTQRCMGQPPVAMPFAEARGHFGIAQRLDKGAVLVSTFGEWSNRGGSATIRLFVLVPKNVTYKLEKGLHGKSSQASSKFSPADPALKSCYWYAGPRPETGWKPIRTDLHFNRFLKGR